MFARAGGVLAPMLQFLRGVSPLAPMVLCGLCPLVGSALTLLLPETANKRLPDTVEDVEGPDFRFGSAHFSIKTGRQHLGLHLQSACPLTSLTEVTSSILASTC